MENIVKEIKSNRTWGEESSMREIEIKTQATWAQWPKSTKNKKHNKLNRGDSSMA